LALGILSIVPVTYGLFPRSELVAGIAAVIFGHLAKYRGKQVGHRWMALTGLALGYGAIVLSLLGLNPYPPKAKIGQSSVKCASHLKQVGLAARLWAADNGGSLPKDFLQFQFELATPKILWCPSDVSRSRATNWNTLTPSNVSYVIVSPGTTNQDPATVFARCPIHGHEVMVDGSVNRNPVPPRR
jgi:hypothetical protein